jgi:hypothetical protein
VIYVNEKVASLDDVLERCDGAQATFLPFIRDILWYVPLLLRVVQLCLNYFYRKLG